MKKKITDIAKIVPSVLWMGVIYRYSDMPAVRSTNQSVTVTERILMLLSRFVTIEDAKKAVLIETFEPYIRKLAHMTEYALLFLLCIPAVMVFVKERKRAVAVSALVSFLYACSDEIHQLFVPGRSGSPKDVGVDMIGTGAAALVYIIFSNAISRHAGKDG